MRYLVLTVGRVVLPGLFSKDREMYGIFCRGGLLSLPVPLFDGTFSRNLGVGVLNKKRTWYVSLFVD